MSSVAPAQRGGGLPQRGGTHVRVNVSATTHCQFVAGARAVCFGLEILQLQRINADILPEESSPSIFRDVPIPGSQSPMRALHARHSFISERLFVTHSILPGA